MRARVAVCAVPHGICAQAQKKYNFLISRKKKIFSHHLCVFYMAASEDFLGQWHGSPINTSVSTFDWIVGILKLKHCIALITSNRWWLILLRLCCITWRIIFSLNLNFQPMSCQLFVSLVKKNVKMNSYFSRNAKRPRHKLYKRKLFF